MKFNLDFDAGRIVEEATITEVGAELLEKVVRIASGEPSRAELLGHDELICIARI
jgi:altronate dehydratase